MRTQTQDRIDALSTHFYRTEGKLAAHPAYARVDHKTLDGIDDEARYYMAAEASERHNRPGEVTK